MFSEAGSASALLASVLLASSASSAQAASCPRPAIAISRWEEDYAFLADPACRTERWDPLKYVALGESGGTWLSLGADLRERYEMLDHPDFSGEEADRSGYWLQRYMVHADLHLGDRFRAFLQLKSGLEHGRTGGPRPTDEDRLDLHQAFVDGKVELGESTSVALRVGRQEVSLGSARLVGLRESPNVRRAFDGLRLTVGSDEWSVDGLALASAETERGVFDDGTILNEKLWGVYAVGPIVEKGLSLDLYYLGLTRHDAPFDRRVEDEQRHSFGTRIWGTPGAWDYNFELVYQAGEFGGHEIRAWTAASDTGFRLTKLPTRPRLGLRANVTSGDHDPDDHRLETFNPLFPKGAYFGEAALIGPKNHIDLHPMLGLELRRNLVLTFAWDFFWRESTSDALYRVSGSPLVAGDANGKRYVGSQSTLALEWKPDRHWTLSAEYEHFLAGPFLRDAGRHDVDFVAVWVDFKI